MKTHRIPIRRQRGAVAIMFALLLALGVVFGTMGLALDLGTTYDMKTELQNSADAAALAGAKDLNGTLTGINNAVTKAKAIAASNKYGYSKTLTLPNSAIGFATTPDSATWLSVSAAQAAPSGLLFIKVTTPVQTRNNWFMQVAGGATTTSAAASAVAGRFSVGVAPLAVCALSTTKYESKNRTPPLPAELLEFGYRRGLTYDVINLNPLGADANKYLLNPLDIPSGPTDNSCTPSNNNSPTVRPFICTGNASIISKLPGYVFVNTGMQATLNADFNARFTTGGTCTVPPDANVRQYTATSTTPAWMSPLPGTNKQGLKLVEPVGAKPADKNLIPFLDKPEAAAAKSDWGVLWSYSKAVQYGSGSPPFTAYSTADWPTLYPGGPTAVSYPTAPAGAATPYNQTSGPYFQAGTGARERRVLNVAMADCSSLQKNAKCDTLKILGVGRFFMPVPADVPKNLFLEFAGLVDDAALTSEIKLYK